MSAQRARSSVAPANRSAHPNLPGVPWWAAVLIAVIATTIGFAFDAGSGSKELGNVFAVIYVVGCVAAVLAVRHSSIFTAVIQPPLILFVLVPASYFLFHGASFTGIKDTLINFGYPLIERFPLMLFTSAGVLLIGLVRWYFGMSAKSSAAARPADDNAESGPGLFAGLAAKLSGLRRVGDADEDGDGEAAPRKHGIDRPATAEKRPRSTRPAKRPAPTRSRHARPPLEDITESPERPRRQSSRRRPVEADSDVADYPDIPRRRRQPRDPNTRSSPSRREPREPRESREPRERRDPPSSPSRRSSRVEPYEAYPSYEPYPPYEPPTRQRPPGRTNGDSDTHHPVSRVRYRGEGEDEGRRSRSRRPSANDWDAESWRFDR